MEKLYNYLQKIGIQERPKHGSHNEPPAVFYRETYGDAGYFQNAPNHTHPGAVVALDYNTEAPAEYFRDLIEKETRIAAYCKKYGYFCRRDICHYSKTVYFYIERQSDREAANDYFYFRDASIMECNQAAHSLYIQDRAGEVEKTLRAIMDKYGASYSEFLQSIGKEKATA